MEGQRVFIYKMKEASYPEAPPFHPAAHPEYLFDNVSEVATNNHIYQSLRSLFNVAQLDKDHYGKSHWNPLGDFIKPGNTVLIKPNLIKGNHPSDPQGWKYVLTNGSLIRAVSDYVWIALKGKGKIVVADAPQPDSYFKDIVRVTGLNYLKRFYNDKGLDFEYIDLRFETYTTKNDVVVDRIRQSGDPNGSIKFDLGIKSEFLNHNGSGKYYGADYYTDQLNEHHQNEKHEYLIAGTAIKSDVIINLPKLKTHKKTGITASLKNLVGITANKNWLPHHTEGHPNNGGDGHPDPSFLHWAEKKIANTMRRNISNIPGMGTWLHRKSRGIGVSLLGDSESTIRNGNWWGNDTIWRMCLDLNKILLYGNADGTFRTPSDKTRKKYISIIDAVIAGGGNGPLNPDPVDMKSMILGTNPASTDAVCAYLMGFDPDKLPIVREAFKCNSYPIADWIWQDIDVKSNNHMWNGSLSEISPDSTYVFKPHFGWLDKIERNQTQ